MENTKTIALPLNKVNPFDNNFVLSDADDMLTCSQDRMKRFLFDLMIPGSEYYEMNDFILSSYGAFMEMCLDEYGMSVISFSRTFVKLIKGLLSRGRQLEDPIVAWYHILSRYTEIHYRSSLLACAYNAYKEDEQIPGKLEDLIDMGDSRIKERLQRDLEFAEVNKNMPAPRPHVEILQ